MSNAGDAIRRLGREDIQAMVGCPGRLPDHEAERIRQRFAEVADSCGKSEAQIRPEVMKFARIMEAQLRATDGKRIKMSADELLTKMPDAVAELGDALDALAMYRDAEWPIKDIGTQAADVANFAMMVADVSGALNG